MQGSDADKGRGKSDGNCDHRQLTEDTRGAIERIRSLIVKRMLQAIRSAQAK
jgi:hypothetical protein